MLFTMRSSGIWSVHLFSYEPSACTEYKGDSIKVQFRGANQKRNNMRRNKGKEFRPEAFHISAATSAAHDAPALFFFFFFFFFCCRGMSFRFRSRLRPTVHLELLARGTFRSCRKETTCRNLLSVRSPQDFLGGADLRTNQSCPRSRLWIQKSGASAFFPQKKSCHFSLRAGKP
jgi:hypothetical protein